MKHFGQRNYCLNYRNYQNLMPLTSSDTKRTLMYSCLQIPPREKWFQYVRSVYATAINFPCIITFILTSHLIISCHSDLSAPGYICYIKRSGSAYTWQSRLFQYPWSRLSEYIYSTSFTVSEHCHIIIAVSLKSHVN